MGRSHRAPAQSRPPRPPSQRAESPLAPRDEALPGVGLDALGEEAVDSDEATPTLAAAAAAADPLDEHRARVQELVDAGAFDENGGLSSHGTSSAALEGIHQSGGRLMSGRSLSEEGIERVSGEGDSFRASRGERSTISVGVGEAGLGTALAYADASREMNHYNVRRMTEDELEEELGRLRTISSEYEVRDPTRRHRDYLQHADGSGEISTDGGVQERYLRMRTYRARLDQLEAERARRDLLPEDDPGRVGGEESLDDYPIVFEMDTSGQRRSEVQNNLGEAEVTGDIDLGTQLRRAYVPLENVDDARARIREMTGRDDVEVIAIEAFDDLPAQEGVVQTRANAMDRMRQHEGHFRGMQEALVAAQESGEALDGAEAVEHSLQRAEQHQAEGERRRAERVERARDRAAGGERAPEWAEEDAEEEAVRVLPPPQEVGAVRRLPAPVEVGDAQGEEEAEEEAGQPAVVVRPTIRVGTPEAEPSEEAAEVEAEEAIIAPVTEAEIDLAAGTGSVRAGRARSLNGRRVQTDAGVGYDEDGVNASIRRQERFQAEEDDPDDPDAPPRDFTANSRELAWRDGAARLSAGSSGQVTGDDGERRVREDSTEVALGPDEVSIARRRERTRVREDGTEVADSASGSVNLLDGTATGTIGRQERDEDGTVRRGVSATGTVDLDDQGNLEAASGSVTATQGPAQVSVSGNVRVSAEAVERLDDGRYQVSWTREIGAGGSGGGQGSGGSASLNLSGAQSDRGVRIFDPARYGGSAHRAHQAAEEFREHAAGRLGEQQLAGSAADVLDMEAGESRGQSRSGTVGVQGSANIRGFQLGGDASRTESASQRVERIDEDTAVAEVDRATLDRAGITGGVGLLSMRQGVSQREEHRSRVRFDLSSPAGRAALDQWLQQGTLPTSREGWHVELTEDTEAAGDEFTMDAGLIQGGRSGEVAETDRIRGDGSREHEIQGQASDTVSVALLGESEQSRYFRATTTTGADGEESTEYTLGTEIDSDNAEDAAYGLGRNLGVGQMDADGEASGQWSVETSLSPAQVQAFTQAVRSNRADVRTLQFDLEAGADLRAALRRAGDDEQAQARAIAQFVSDSGPDGLAWVRRHSGATGPADLTLEGSQVFRGAAWRQEFEARLARYERAVEGGGSEGHRARQSARGELRQQRSRLRQLRDGSRYQELPREIRDQEIERTQGWITRLEAVTHRRIRATQEERERAAAEGPLGEDMVRHAPPEEQELERTQERIREIRSGAVHARASCRRGRTAAEEGRQAHAQGGLGRESHRERLGQRAGSVTGFLGLESDGAAVQAYERSDRLFGEGVDSQSAADRCFDSAEAALARLDDPERTHAIRTDARQASLYFRTAVSTYWAAKGKFDSVTGQLAAILREHGSR